MRLALLFLGLLAGCRSSSSSSATEMRCAHRWGTEWAGFTPDGQRVVSTGKDGLKVWTLAGQLEHHVTEVVGKRNVPERGVFDEAGHFYGVVVGGLGGPSPTPPFPSGFVPIPDMVGKARDQVVSARGGVVGLLQRGSVRFVDLARPERPIQHPLPEAEALQGTSAADVLAVATFSRSGKSTLWAFDLRQPDSGPRALGGGQLPRALTLSRDGRRLALHLDLKLTVIDVATGQQLWAAGRRGHALEPTGFTEDGQWLLAGDQKFDQSSWNVATGQRRAVDPYVPARAGAWLRAVSPQRNEVVFAREGDRLEVYDLDLKPLGTLGAKGAYGLKNVPMVLTVSPDGQWVALEHASRVHLWNLGTRAVTPLVDGTIKATGPPCGE